MDRGAWWATVHGVTKSRPRLSAQHFHLGRLGHLPFCATINTTLLCTHPLEKVNCDCSSISEESACVTGCMWVISTHPTTASRAQKHSKSANVHCSVKSCTSVNSVLNLIALWKYNLFYSTNEQVFLEHCHFY